LAAESSDNAAIIIAGIIGGAIIGNNIEASAGVLQGHEYLLETETGKLLTVAQPDSGNDILGIGSAAILVYGYPHRLTRDPR
jgi:outer membrane lipoprotein SlyB